MAVQRPVMVGAGLVGGGLAGGIDGWLASNDVNNAANAATNPTEAPDSIWQSQASIYKGILLAAGALAMAYTGGRAGWPVAGAALTARQVAFHLADDGSLPAQG